MSKSLLLTTVAAGAVLGIASAASAADIMPAVVPVVVAPVPVVQPFNWSGFYLGVNGIAGLTTLSGPSTPYYGDYYARIAGSSFTAAVGATAGINVQRGNAVFGIEVDGHWGLRGATLDTYDDEYYLLTADWNWYATLRGRMGLAADRALFYVTGGLLVAQASYAVYYYDDMTPYSYDRFTSGVQLGLALGAGTEIALSDRLSWKMEYLHLTLPPSAILTSVDGYNIQFTSHANVIQAGINFRFGG